MPTMLNTAFALLVTIPSLVNAAISNRTVENLYIPFDAKCPSKNSSSFPASADEGFIRSNFDISQDEYSWISARQIKSTSNLIDFLDGLIMTDYQNTTFVDYFEELNQSTINIGLSFSGGGFRALLTGAGEIEALDSRSLNDSALKGLLDASTYISGLSGGSIMLATLIYQNWTSVGELIDSNTTIWNFTQPPVQKDFAFWEDLLAEVSPKKEAGFEISLIDIYGRILSKYMFEKEDDNYGINTLWSDIQDIDAFVNFDMPFPVIVAAGGVAENLTDYSKNLFEITPFEFGSWSPFVGGFIPIELLGSMFDAGLPDNSSLCTYEFDNAGLMVASSSNILIDYEQLLNEFLAGDSNVTSIVAAELGMNVSVPYAKALLSLVNPDFDDILYTLLDNPFYGSSLSTNDSDVSEGETLKLVDGGAFDEALPMDPFLVPSREIDVIIAFDNTGETYDNWPNGTSLFATEERWLDSFPDDEFYDLPSSAEEFIELGLNKVPVFFGCNGSTLITQEDTGNATVDFSYMKPLLVYIPNTNYTYMSNTSAIEYSYEERDAMINNGFRVATTDDENFAKCVGCAIIRRSEERLGKPLGPECSKCFAQYCYSSGPESTTEVVESAPTSIYASTVFPSSLDYYKSTRSHSIKPTSV